MNHRARSPDSPHDADEVGGVEGESRIPPLGGTTSSKLRP